MNKFRGVIKKLFLPAILIIALALTGCGEISDHEAEAINDGLVAEETKGYLKVHFIDVGQGDSILIQQINGDAAHNMLIDAGSNGDGNYLVNYLKEQGINTLDYVIGTHPHEDHIGGLDEIINNFNIIKVVMPKVTITTQTFTDVVTAIKNKNLKITTPIVGDEYKLGDAKWVVLAPNSGEYGNLNNYSVVSRLVFGENSFILTGDAEEISEAEILENFDIESLTSDVLKAGHHGSNSSSSDNFLDAVSPKYAVITSGVDNFYRHPDKEMIEKLSEKNIEILRLDQLGTIVIASDGKNLSYYKKKDAPVVANPSESETTPAVEISALDKKGELLTINSISDKDVDMTGWKLVSLKGNQQFLFPSYTLKAGTSVTVGGFDSKDISDFDWEEGNGIWSNSDSDPAELYDASGNMVSRFDD
ncbi:MBL fold metallo-hydrolase [Tissierella creatinini]|nr:MBL fold metallo-hydrolase [Tissierella creatinini]TJX62805.1 MBL fold metallo-hydrolase [Soehngenia saccharolytica]